MTVLDSLPDCFESVVTLDANSRMLPDSVKKEISDDLWPILELSDNDTAFFEPDEWEADYPGRFVALPAYLREVGLPNGCSINYGW